MRRLVSEVHWGAAAIALVALWPREARCEDLRATADRVAELWHEGGGYVGRDEPRFLYDGETVTVVVPAGPELACETIALIGARGLSFHARVSDDGAPDTDERITSVAGVLELSSCGAPPFRFVRVTSEAGRGALETVVARSTEPLPPLRTILLERTGGVLPAPAEPGALPPLPLPDRRAAVSEARAHREGATVSPRAEWLAGADGKGEGRMVLEAGCHRVELFAPDIRSATRSRLDLDATLRDEDGEVLAHDHTSAPDARIDVCLGEVTTTTVLFEGAPPGAPVLGTHAYVPIPQRLPLTWGRETRARMAAAILPRHIGTLEADAILLVQGASGLTPVPLEIEPGACYVAVAALERGHAHGLGLRVTLGASESVDERGTNDDASAVAFCADDHDHARIEVEARSTGVSWGLAVFRVAGGIWGSRR